MSGVRFSQTSIPGLTLLSPEPRRDERGYLTKDFVREVYAAAGLPTEFAEELHTLSHAGVLRGLHFQLPSSPQSKVLFCHYGAIFEAVVDLRVGSPAFGQFDVFDLSADNARGLFIPAGLAHGFCVPEGDALVAYRLTTGLDTAADAGIRWDSVGIPWPVANPVISARDSGLPPLAEFSSPFAFGERRD